MKGRSKIPVIRRERIENPNICSIKFVPNSGIF